MEFSGQYLTYQEYLYLGGTLHPMPFNLIEFVARRKIDEKTKQRLVGSNDIPNEVKLCIFDIIGLINKYEIKAEKNKSSETVGSYSVTYNDIKEIFEQKETEINDIILTELYGVMFKGEHIIYSGV